MGRKVRQAKNPIGVFLGSLILVLFASSTSALASSESEKLRLVQNQVFKIQRLATKLSQHLGVNQVESNTLVDLEFATEREIYQAAQSLYQNSNQLCFEASKFRALEIPPPLEALTYHHSAQVLSGAVDRLNCVIEHWNIENSILGDPIIESSESDLLSQTDLFLMITKTNDTIGQLLEQPIHQTDVFHQITLALAVATRIRQAYPAPRMPEEPALLHNAEVSDSFLQLLRCFGLLTTISKRLGVFLPDISATTGVSVEARHVYELASFLNVELQHIYAAMEQDRTALPVPYPATKTINEVYQRAQLLELLLRDIDNAIIQNTLAGAGS